MSEDEIVNNAAVGVQKVLETIVAPIKESNSTLTTSRIPVSRNKGYSPIDIIREHQNMEKQKLEQQLAKENTRKQRELEAQERQKQRELANKMREEENARKRQEKLRKEEEKQKRILSSTCVAKCGRTCRTGPGWVGCEKCDVFWVCPSCFSVPKHKRMLTLHEKRH